MVRCRNIRQISASSRPLCDGTSSACVWPSPRQTPGPSYPYSSGRTPRNHEANWHGPALRIPTRQNPMGGILRVGPNVEVVDASELCLELPLKIISCQNEISQYLCEELSLLNPVERRLPADIRFENRTHQHHTAEHGYNVTLLGRTMM